MSDSRLILSPDLGEFFRQEVADAKGQLQIRLNDATEFYLVNLLCDFSRKDPGVGDEPLALLYKRAMEATPAERFTLLKNLGDMALYVAGYFVEFVESSMVDVDYYVAMGGSAYGNLSSMVGNRKNGESIAELYTQLAKHFTDLVDLLNEVADRQRDNSAKDKDLLRLYERWTRTKSVRIQRLLAERGMFPAGGLFSDTSGVLQ